MADLEAFLAGKGNKGSRCDDIKQTSKLHVVMFEDDTVIVPTSEARTTGLRKELSNYHNMWKLLYMQTKQT